MIKDIKQGAYGIEGKLYSKIFGTEIDVMIDDDADIEYAQKCAEHFNNITDKMLDTICRAAKDYCLDFMKLVEDDWDEELAIPVNSETPVLDMLKYFRPQVLIIEKPDDENRIGYQLECSCDWEQVGMEIDILETESSFLVRSTAIRPGAMKMTYQII